MPIWGKKKERDPFDDFFGDFSRIQRMMDEMLRRAFEEEPLIGERFAEKIKPGKPLVYGFSFKMGPEGKPSFEQFGNIEPGESPSLRDEREPLVDVINKQKIITVLAELPGVDKKEIKLDVAKDGEHLVIDVPNKFFKKLKLPAKVLLKTAKAQYKNGVLEVDLTKKESGTQEGAIKIE